jgi:hypothetical protein
MQMPPYIHIPNAPLAIVCPPLHVSSRLSPPSQNGTRNATALVVAALNALCLSARRLGRLEDALGDARSRAAGAVAVDERRTG